MKNIFYLFTFILVACTTTVSTNLIHSNESAEGYFLTKGDDGETIISIKMFLKEQHNENGYRAPAKAIAARICNSHNLKLTEHTISLTAHDCRSGGGCSQYNTMTKSYILNCL